MYDLFVGKAINGILHSQNYKPCFTALAVTLKLKKHSPQYRSHLFDLSNASK